MSDLLATEGLGALRTLTTARVALERTGNALSTREMLAFASAHAAARDAVHTPFSAKLFAQTLAGEFQRPALSLHSRAMDRASYLRHPPLGRSLDEASAASLQPCAADLVIVLGDGLSAKAVERHALALLRMLLPLLGAEGWTIAPLCCVEQARVAIGDEIGERMGVRAALVLLGERPGLSAPSSLGAYLTWLPRVGTTDAYRNCLSNIHDDGVSPSEAAQHLVRLLGAARSQQRTGVLLKLESADPKAGTLCPID